MKGVYMHKTTSILNMDGAITARRFYCKYRCHIPQKCRIEIMSIFFSVHRCEHDFAVYTRKPIQYNLLAAVAGLIKPYSLPQNQK